jgi:hypothetical protein
MFRRTLLTIGLLLPPSLAAQSSGTPESPDRTMLAFETFADIFGSRLVAAFDSIPAARYDYRPTPPQQTIGYIAQHLEDANYGLCEHLSDLKHTRTSKDSLADTVKARWPKDTLVTRLKASLDFCDAAMKRVETPQLPALTFTLLGFETDLAEHYSQVSTYMRLLGMVPPSALPPKQHTAVALPASQLSQYAGVYELVPGLDLDVTTRDTALFMKSTAGRTSTRLWPESRSDFFVRETDLQLTFTRDASGVVTALVLHQFGRDRSARKIR